MNIKSRARLLAVAAVVAVLAGCGSTAATQAASKSVPAPTATTVVDPNGLACVALDNVGYCPGDDPAQAPVTPKATHKATPKATHKATPKATPTQAPPQPAGPTESQQQALTSAQSYLDLGSGFSWQGLADQLDSPYGGKFSVADATWAANHSGADWNAQAVLAAKGYMALGTGFSRQGLIDQLDSPYGGKFTYAQAAYAAGQVGL